MKEDRKAVNGISFLCRITFHPVHVLSIICTWGVIPANPNLDLTANLRRCLRTPPLDDIHSNNNSHSDIETLKQVTPTGEEMTCSSRCPPHQLVCLLLYCNFWQSVWAWLSVWKQQGLSQDGRQRRDAEPPEQDMGQAAGSSQRQPYRAGGFLHPLNLHLGCCAHDSADLRGLLLLSQDQDEGSRHLSKYALHMDNL